MWGALRLAPSAVACVPAMNLTIVRMANVCSGEHVFCPGYIPPDGMQRISSSGGSPAAGSTEGGSFSEISPETARDAPPVHSQVKQAQAAVWPCCRPYSARYAAIPAARSPAAFSRSPDAETAIFSVLENSCLHFRSRYHLLVSIS